MIEDISHGHGVSVDGEKIGSLGSISVFSLHRRKSVSVGDSGIVCTNDPDIYEKIDLWQKEGNVRIKGSDSNRSKIDPSQISNA